MSNSIQRIFKKFNIENDLVQFLSNIQNKELVSETLDESINSWLHIPDNNIEYNINNIVYSYKDIFYDIQDKVKIKMNNIPVHRISKREISFDNGNTYINVLNRNNISEQEYNEFIDRCENSEIPSLNEYLPEHIFPETEGYKIIHEPNGRNECPDIKVIYPDGRETYIEIKSVLGGFYSDGKFYAKVNNAMKGTDQILTDLQKQHESKDNICHTHLRDITVIFFYYYCDPYNSKVYIFKSYVVPAPLTIDCEFNSDGTFKKLGQKSDNNFNTVLSLKIRTPFNKYNSLADRANLISYGYTINNLNRLISNSEGDFYVNKKQFHEKLVELENELLGDNIHPQYIIDLYNELKELKYNRSKYALSIDKQYIKDIFKKLKKSINSKFGKGTIR